jgi:lipid-A-disaccharide synthase
MSACVMLAAAEASGDALGADLARALRARLGEDTRFIGLGGPAMAGEGVNSPFDISELSVVGLLEGLLAAGRAARRADELAELAVRERPDAAVLIDSWGFSYLLAKRLRKRLPGLPLVKYVLPQVWASRPARARTAARLFDRLLSIIAFEAPVFEAADGKVDFVGHPALAAHSPGDGARLRARLGVSASDPILLVLPGSRPSEVARLMGPFEDAARRLKAGRPGLQIVLVAAPTVAQAVKSRLATWPGPVHLIEDTQGKQDAFVAATVALACSGTVTTELAAAGCPMVVAYRLGAVTYQIARRIVRTRYITLFNIAAGEEIAPELIQDRCTGPALAGELARRLDDPAMRARQAEAQREALQALGVGGPPPAERAAEIIAGVISAA